MPIALAHTDWDSMHSMPFRKGTPSNSMNAAAAALDNIEDPLQIGALMNEDLAMGQHLLLNGDGDVPDMAFLGDRF